MPNGTATKSTLVAQMGQGILPVGFILDYTDLQTTSGAGAKTFNLPVLPQGSFMLAIRIKHSTAFVAANLTAMKVRVGKVGGTTNFFAGDFDVFQAPADGNLSESFSLPMGQLTGVQPTVTFTPTGASCSAATAGQVQVTFVVLPITTANAQ